MNPYPSSSETNSGTKPFQVPCSASRCTSQPLLQDVHNNFCLKRNSPFFSVLSCVRTGLCKERTKVFLSRSTSFFSQCPGLPQPVLVPVYVHKDIYCANCSVCLNMYEFLSQRVPVSVSQYIGFCLKLFKCQFLPQDVQVSF
jgi:hypothetical protein